MPANDSLVNKVLADPAKFPDTFTQWIPRWINQNINVKLRAVQLPSIETTKLVGGVGQPAFQNSWVNFGSTDAVAGFYKDYLGRIYVNGKVKSGTPGASSVIFTLPAGYLPKTDEMFAVTSNGAFGVCRITQAGDVIALSGSTTYFSLAGISFRAFA